MKPDVFTIFGVKVVLIGFVGYLEKNLYRAKCNSKNQVFGQKSICMFKNEEISTADRNCLWKLKNAGHDMTLLSCSTPDLSERILKFAGIADCFDCGCDRPVRQEKKGFTLSNFHFITSIPEIMDIIP